MCVFFSTGNVLSHNTSLTFENWLIGDPVTKDMDEFLEYDNQGILSIILQHQHTCVLTLTQLYVCVCALRKRIYHYKV